MAKKVLVVDDDKEIREIFKDVLVGAGYEVFTAKNGKGAIKIINNDKKIQTIFIDLRLGKMSGIELCRKIRKMMQKVNPTLVIVAITGYPDEFNLLECSKAGFNSFFAKPIKSRTLIKVARLGFEKMRNYDIKGNKKGG